MYTVILVNLAAIAFAYRAGATLSDRWLKLAFLTLFVFLALRYDYGNDYSAYLALFQDADRVEMSLRLEPAWQLVSVLFRPLGFFVMVAALAAFNCWAYYRFTKAFVPPKYYAFAVFLYVFTPYFMLVHASAMRQSVAIALFLLAIPYIESRNPIKYFLCIGLAATFHASALVLLPVYALAWIRGRIPIGAALAVFTVYVIAVLMAGELKPFVDHVVETYATRYEHYQAGTELGTGMGLLFGSVVLAVILLFARQQEGSSLLLVKLAAISYFATVPVGIINSMAGRIGMYFSPVLIAVVPLVASRMKDHRVGALFLAAYGGVTLYQFYSFFQSDVWRDAFETYSTIFSAPQFY